MKIENGSLYLIIRQKLVTWMDCDVFEDRWFGTGEIVFLLNVESRYRCALLTSLGLRHCSLSFLSEVVESL